MENKYSNKYIIETGIGLQDVDHLKNSSYFINESEKYIRGEITLDELEKTVSSYYKNKPDEEERSEEADIIAVRIAKIISDDSFSFTAGQLVAIHKQLFDGVLSHAGQLRTYNFTKNEWVLDGASVSYGDYRDMDMMIQFDINSEKRFRYAGLSKEEILDHLAGFIANIWQAHPFGEGNTRTTAVFTIKYLRSLGFDVTNDAFAKNAWYFRNALVRANYNNLQKGIYEDRSYLVKFLRNLIFNENNPLHNKELHVSMISNVEMPTKENRIIKLMKDNPYIKVEEISRELNVSPRTIKSVIASLTKDGVIKRVGGKKLGHWEINK